MPNTTLNTYTVGVAFGGVANLWGGYLVPSPEDFSQVKTKGFNRISFPFGATTNPAQFLALVKQAKSLGLRVHIVHHHDSIDPYMPFDNPAQLVDLNRQFAALLADVLTSGDTVEVDNEPVPPPGANWGDTQKIYAPQGPYHQALAAWRWSCPAASIGVPITGDQTGVEALHITKDSELDLSSFRGFDFIGAHPYIVGIDESVYPRQWMQERLFSQISAIDFLASETGLPWLATEFGVDLTFGTSPLIYRDVAAMCDWFAPSMCRGRIAWQWGGPANTSLKNSVALQGCLPLPVVGKTAVASAP